MEKNLEALRKENAQLKEYIKVLEENNEKVAELLELVAKIFLRKRK